MSKAYDRGKQLEQELAAIIRKKTGTHSVRDSRSGANWHRRSDIFSELPIHIEAKDHETIKIKEWFRQADAAASYQELAVVAFRCDEFILATCEFHKLVDLYVELADLRAQLEDYRTTPAPLPTRPGISEFVAKNKTLSKKPVTDADIKKITEKLEPAVETKVSRGAVTCRAGHIADDWGYCMQKDCQYRRGYVNKRKGKK